MLKLKPIIAAKAKERMLSGKPLDPVQNSAQGRTREELAKRAGVSHDTIHKAAGASLSGVLALPSVMA